jgi:hypothetical protein
LINIKSQEDLQLIAALQRDLNLTTAFLLLSGQITIKGIFITPGGFNISLTGPLLGNTRIVGKYPGFITDTIIDFIDVILAILLIIDEIRLLAVLIGPGKLSVTVSGPIFGDNLSQPTLPVLQENYQFFKEIVTKHFRVDPQFMSILEKE